MPVAVAEQVSAVTEALPVYAYTDHVSPAIGPREKGQSDRDCPVGDNGAVLLKRKPAGRRRLLVSSAAHAAESVCRSTRRTRG